jgi:Brp/Blh family beta-carotene 15,15'-monooxygenase
VFIVAGHPESSASILEMMVRHGADKSTWMYWLSNIFPWCTYSLVTSLVLIILSFKKLGWSRENLFQFIVQSALLVSVIRILPLYLSFAFYFGIWHSLLSFNLIRKQMHLSNDWSGWSQLAKKAIPFTVVAWLGILGLIFLSLQTGSQFLILSNVFMGVAVLTLPHLQVFTKVKPQ